MTKQEIIGRVTAAMMLAEDRWLDPSFAQELAKAAVMKPEELTKQTKRNDLVNLILGYWVINDLHKGQKVAALEGLAKAAIAELEDLGAITIEEGAGGRSSLSASDKTLLSLNELRETGFDGFQGLYSALKTECRRQNGRIPFDHGFVYILWAKGTNWYKIGKSKDSNERLKQISPKVMFELEIIQSHFVPFKHKGERFLHQKFKDFRGEGEWFEITDQHMKDLLDGNDLRRRLQSVYWQEIFEKYEAIYTKEAVKAISLHPFIDPEWSDAFVNGWLDLVFGDIMSQGFHPDYFTEKISSNQTQG